MTKAEASIPTDLVIARQRLQNLAQDGLFRHAVAKAYGGFGNGFADLSEAHAVLGRACCDNGLILAINAHIWGALFPIIHFGSEHQKQAYLSDLLNGVQIGGHAITEPQAGSDLTALTMTAEIKEDGFNLNGRKRYITNTPIADLLIVYARLEGKINAFIVHAADTGAEFLDSPNSVGCQTATMGDVILENCRIPTNRQLGTAGSGTMMIQQALELERAFIFAGISGVMAWQLEKVIEFSRKRQIKGAHLGKNQAISHKIADMQLRLDTLRLWIRECAALKDSGKRLTMASSEAKLFGAEAFLQSSLDAVQIMGAFGLENGNPMAGFVDDALASRLFSGSSEIQKNLIAALLGTGEGYLTQSR